MKHNEAKLILRHGDWTTILRGATRGFRRRETAWHLVENDTTSRDCTGRDSFAEVYSTLKPTGGQIILGTVPSGRAIALGQTKWLPLTKLTSITHDSPEYNEKDRAGIFYAQSWLLAHMLILHEDYQEGFSKFVANLSETSDAEKAFEAAYHKKLWEIELDLNSYYHAKSLSGVAYKTRFEKIQMDAARSATELELGIGHPRTRRRSRRARAHDRGIGIIGARTMPQFLLWPKWQCA